MPKSTTGLATPLREQLDRLAALEPTTWPLLSVYLDLRSNQHGRDHYEPFLRKTLPERRRSLKGDARKSYDRDADRIRDYLATLPPSTKGAAIFACSAMNDFFEAIPLGVPLQRHELFLGPVPHLYPLARLNDQYPRYGALLVDTNTARLFVFSLGRTSGQVRVTNDKTRRGALGGWSQARYQRHVENVHLQHMKEVVDVLDRVVREEAIDRIVVACDEVSRPLLMAQLPKELAARIIDVVPGDIRTPESRVLAETLEALHQKDADADREHVEALVDAWRAGGLAVVGRDDTLQALARRQVDELLISSTGFDGDRAGIGDELVRAAHQSGASIRFIEDASLLDDLEGVGAMLRFRIEGPAGLDESRTDGA